MPATKPKSRPYDSSRRRAQAEANRAAVVESAGKLFVAGGYVHTTIGAIATDSGVSAETVYSMFGDKASLLIAWMDQMAEGSENVTPRDQRWVSALKSADNVDSALRHFARGVRGILDRSVPAYSVARGAVRSDERLAVLYRELTERRLATLRVMTGILAEWSPNKGDLDLDEIAEFMWAIVNPFVYEGLTVERSWTGEQYEAHLIAWARAAFGF